MAQKTSVVLTDDLDDGPADETVRFGLDGAQYVIDLSEKNATRLREELAPFITKARRAGGETAGRKGRTAKTAGGRDLTAVREWARVNGWPNISNRGRVAADILDAYDRAHAA